MQEPTMWLTGEDTTIDTESLAGGQEKYGRRKGDQTGAVCVAPSHWLWFP